MKNKNAHKIENINFMTVLEKTFSKRNFKFFLDK